MGTEIWVGFGVAQSNFTWIIILKLPRWFQPVHDPPQPTRRYRRDGAAPACRRMYIQGKSDAWSNPSQVPAFFLPVPLQKAVVGFKGT